MVIVHQSDQPFLQHMGVNLRGGDVGVAEQLLHGAQVGAVLQKVAGKGVAQHVRRYLRGGNAGPRGQPLQFARENLARQVAAVGG